MANRFEQLLQRVEGRGVRLTAPRRRVIAAIASFDAPFSAGRLVEAVARRAPEVGRATVFRTLQLLCEWEVLERVRLEGGQDVYVIAHLSAHHHHLICNRCGEIQEVEGCQVAHVADAVALRRGFLPRGHAFEVYGLCPECQAEASDER